MTAAYLTHGATLALAWFLIVNAIASIVAIAAARVLANRDLTPASWFGLRVLPAIVSTAFVAAVFLPSYWRYEPPSAGEGFDVTLTSLAAAALVLVVFSICQGAAAWRSAVRRERTWMVRARAIGVHGGVPAFEIDAEAPVMALVGIIRPRLIVTTPIASALSGDEMQATIAHEVAHWRSWDNLKRLAMRSSPDVLSLAGAGRAIERRWASAAEHAADHHAGGANPLTRCALASALLTVARMMAESSTPPPLFMGPISTLIDGGDIASRVARLLDDPAPHWPAMRALALCGWTAACGVALAILASYPSWLVGVHEVTEVLVRSLP